MADLDAVEDYAARLQTGSPRAGDLVNVPTALLDASWVSSVVLGADTVLVGTVQSVGYHDDDACSSVLVSVECYPDVLEVPGDHPMKGTWVPFPPLNPLAGQWRPATRPC